MSFFKFNLELDKKEKEFVLEHKDISLSDSWVTKRVIPAAYSELRHSNLGNYLAIISACKGIISSHMNNSLKVSVLLDKLPEEIFGSACWSGETPIIKVNPIIYEEYLTKDCLDYYSAVALHEASHILHSDYKKICDNHKKYGSFYHLIFNPVEDVVVEDYICEESPGFSGYIYKFKQEVLNNIVEPLKYEDTLEAFLQLFFAYYRTPTKIELDSLTEKQTEFFNLMEKITHFKSLRRDRYEVTKKIYDYLKKEFPEETRETERLKIVILPIFIPGLTASASDKEIESINDLLNDEINEEEKYREKETERRRIPDAYKDGRKLYSLKEKRDFSTEYARAKANSAHIKNKLKQIFKFKNHDRLITVREQKHGKLDRNSLGRATLTDRHYKYHYIEKEPKVAFWLLLDASGSMGGIASDVRNIAVGITEGIKDIQEINFRVYSHTSGPEDHFHCMVTELYGPNASKTALGSFRAWAENYDHMAIKYVGDLIAKQPEEKKVLVVCSDGTPAGSYYGGDPAVRKVAEEVKKLRNKDIGVFQIQCGYFDKSTCARMYGEGKYIVFQNLETFARNLEKMLVREAF